MVEPKILLRNLVILCVDARTIHAATALEYNLILVTRNVKDFEGLGITVLNPWIKP